MAFPFWQIRKRQIMGNQLFYENPLYLFWMGVN